MSASDYDLGIDLGTTYTAAAVYRNGKSELLTLGNRAPAIPSVVYLSPDGNVVVGDPANRKAIVEPTRVAREFKRRLGDPTPLFLGGSPLTAEALTARLLEHVVRVVTDREGAPPRRVVLTHPASWGEFKQNVLLQAARRAGVDDPILLPEPVAAAVHYASQRPITAGELVAVYDLGGGTFDITVLRATNNGFEIVGEPSGVDQLGGIDFDQAVLGHVDRSLGGVMQALDLDDPAITSALARLRNDAVEAKEALSADSEISIPVTLPSHTTEVRLTRSEYEDLIRPLLAETATALQRGLRSAGVTPADISRVLLVGGSSRTPVIAQILTAEFDRPVTVDVDPKYSVALGAAASAGVASPALSAPEPSAPAAPPAPPVAVVEAPAPPPPPPPAVTPPPPPPPAAAAPVVEPTPEPAAPAAATLDTPPPVSVPEKKRRTPLLIAAAVLVVGAIVGVVVAVSGGGDSGGDAGGSSGFATKGGVVLQKFSATDSNGSCTVSWTLDKSTVQTDDALTLTWKGTAAAEGSAWTEWTGTVTLKVDGMQVSRGGTVIAEWTPNPSNC